MCVCVCASERACIAGGGVRNALVLVCHRNVLFLFWVIFSAPILDLIKNFLRKFSLHDVCVCVCVVCVCVCVCDW